MRKRVGIYGASDEALTLIPLLAANSAIEIVAIVDRNALGLLDRLPRLEPALAALLEQTLGNDPSVLIDDETLYAVVDAGDEMPFEEQFPAVLERGLQVVSPLTARLLWGLGTPTPDHKTELLQSLHEVVESYNLTVHADELFHRILEIAIGITNAEGGSLMLLDPSGRELAVRVAVGVEPELWAKIRLPIGDGIAGRVAAEGRSLRLRGRADRERFRIVHERVDVESAISVPLIHDGRVLGVLNLHHGTRTDAFSEEDLAFTEELARLDAQIIARAQEHEALRSQAARYAAVREVRAIMSGPDPLSLRLRQLCEFVAACAGGGIATIYRCDGPDGAMRIAATSLDGGDHASDYRMAPGQGIDGQVAASGQPAFLRRPDGAIAYAALPLAIEEHLVGVLAIQSGAHPLRSRAAEEMLLEIAAGTAEEMLDAEREARLASRASAAQAVGEAGIRMISTNDPGEVLRLGTSAAAEALAARHAVLRMQDEQTQRYAIRSYAGPAQGPVREQLFRLDRAVSLDVLKRRDVRIEGDVGRDPDLALHAGEIRCCLAAPLHREGRIVGTLALYDELAGDGGADHPFEAEDAALFSQLVSYLERALANAFAHQNAQRFRHVDDVTGLPNATYLTQRIGEEIARAGSREGGLALSVARVANLTELEGAGDSATSRVLRALVEALRRHARAFDVVGRCDAAEFAVLLPEPGDDPAERVLDLARAVSEEIRGDRSLEGPVRVALSFGYAVHPKDGTDAASLLARAREPRIQLV